MVIKKKFQTWHIPVNILSNASLVLPASYHKSSTKFCRAQNRYSALFLSLLMFYFSYLSQFIYLFEHVPIDLAFS